MKALASANSMSRLDWTGRGGTGNLSASISNDEEDTDGQCLSDTDPQQCKEMIKTEYEKHPLRAHRGPEEETSSNQKFRQECEPISDGIGGDVPQYNRIRFLK